jgi:uncharacterized protein YjeT (DUF2065 family)
LNDTQKQYIKTKRKCQSFILHLIYFELSDKIFFVEGKKVTIATIIIIFAIIGYCLTVLLVPRFFRYSINFFLIGSRLYLAGLMHFILGMAILSAASGARWWGYVTTIGLLWTGSGLSLFFFALKRTKRLVQRIQNQSDLSLRIFAIFALAIWTVLVYALLPAVAAFSLHQLWG